MKSILNYIKVSDNISTSGQPTKKQFKIIAENKFDVVINLAMHNKGALKKEDKIVSKNGMIYIHIPITWKAPEIDRLELFLQLLKTLQKEKKKVFIHCIMNYRASVFIYLYKKLILNQQDAEIIAPKEFKPKKVWKKLIKSTLKEDNS
ncbi:MAG: protein tyrosine phosphatase family protein [Thiovulaceae bacterium]|nr:protein tyrosine phosphatase family protein [Sulfurimonadaceae bacterium]MCW9026692.1 protein tyrosine phosphatase family protein [Sulfurimonadaceae bacterium]